MSRPDTPGILIPAIASTAAAVGRLNAAAKKKPLTKRQQASLASAIEKLNDYVRRYAGLISAPAPVPSTPGEPVPASSDPFPGKSMAERNRAWNHIEARDNINAGIQRLAADGIANDDLAGQLAGLGEGLAGQALALGIFGSPDSTYGAGLPWGLAAKWGGRWGNSSGHDERGFYVRVWNGGKQVHEELDPVSSPDPQTVGMAHGLNGDTDGPADDYRGEFTAPVDF